MQEGRTKKLILAFVVMALVVYYVIRRLNDGEVPLFGATSGGYVMPGDLTRSFSLLDYGRYASLVVEEYFKDYAVIVKISFLILLVSSATLIFNIGLGVRSARRDNKYRHRLLAFTKEYGSALYDVLASHHDMSEGSIRQHLGLENGYRVESLNEARLWYDAYVRNFLSMNAYTNFHNLNIVVRTTGLLLFFENTLMKGHREERIAVAQALQAMLMPISVSYVSTMINHKDKALRKEGRLLYALNSNNDSFDILYEDTPCYWDMMQLHMMMQQCVEIGKRIPPLDHYMHEAKDPHNKAFLIEETGYWDDYEKVKAMIPYIESDNDRISRAAIKAMARRRVKEAAPTMIEEFHNKSFHTRRLIMRSLFLLHVGDMEDFFANAYRVTTSFHTRRVALLCLYYYSPKGKDMFDRLYAVAEPEEKVLFTSEMADMFLGKPISDNLNVQNKTEEDKEYIDEYVADSL